jgi:DNA-directed RNA polymerase specialized sigma24 family protein
VSTPPGSDDPSLSFADILTTESVRQDVSKMALRYSDAILAYATALLRDSPEDAEDVRLAVVQKMLAGDFSRSTVKGRFRFFVKQAVRNAVRDHLRKKKRHGHRLRRLWAALVPGKHRGGWALEQGGDLPADADPERDERDIWRSTVLRRTLEGLQKYERAHQERVQPNVYHTLVGLLVDHPDATSEDLAERLGQVVGGEFNAGQVRGIVLRMRRKFAELLFTEVAQHCANPVHDEVIDEMCELSLFAYARPYLPPREPAAVKA